MVLTQTQKSDIKDVVRELYNDDWIANLVAKITDLIKTEFQMKLDSQEKEIQKLQEDLSKEKEKNVKLEQKFDNLEQYGRRQNLRIFGITEKANENIEETILELFHNKLNISIEPDMLQRSHRIGAPKDGKNRAIIVKFLSYKHRNLVYKNKRKLKNTKVTIMEDLTPARNVLYWEAVNQLGKNKIWTSDGNIFTFYKNKRHIITNLKDVQEFLSENPITK